MLEDGRAGVPHEGHAKHPGLVLSQDHDPPRPVGKPLEHVVLSSQRGTGRLGVPAAPHGSRVPDPVLNAIMRQLHENFPGHRAFTPSNSAKSQDSSKYAGSERAA